MTFRVGMKVVALGMLSSPAERTYREIRPVRGEVYTVRTIETRPDGTFIRLVEIVNELQYYNNGYGECCFNITRFRPAVSPGISFDTSIPADPDSEQYDNRRRIPVSEWGCSA